jgi:DNA gyrase subunit A
MTNSYIDYAMSVIVGRALPDVKDGLKPVHRRILYAMKDLGNTASRPHKKSARIVGEVLGKYHPHGDTAVYDTMVRMAQEFNQHYLLVDGHGNFGSIDGDSAAAQRYTEARMTRLSESLLEDIDKETVDFIPNYDGTLKEPVVLPARVPNLLINGSSGIAVGMATNIPPHNITEVINSLVHLIDYPECDIDDLMEFIKGPDFPTGACIINKSEMRRIYETGRGPVRQRAIVETLIDEKRNKHRLIIKELPYQVNKARLIESIAQLVTDKKVTGISDIRDESNREGIRVVIELKRDEEPEWVLNQLFKRTNLQTSFGVIMLALVDKKPMVMSLKEILSHYRDHRYDVVRRRTEFELRKAEERAHILEGLKIALDNIDVIIQVIKESENPPAAKEALMNGFDLSDRQAQAILDMRLQRLTGLERDKIESEYAELLQKIAEYKAILADSGRVFDIIKTELLEMRDKYGDDRKTIFVDSVEDITKEDLVKDEEVVITLTHQGYIKRIPLEIYSAQHRGGKGKKSGNVMDDDFIRHIYVANSKDYFFFFTTFGRVYCLKVWEIPEASRIAKGRAVVNFLKLDIAAGEKVAAVTPIKEFVEDKYVILCTSKGIIKKTSLDQYSFSVSRAIIGINLADEDKLVAIGLSDGTQEVMITSRLGKAIRFKEEEVRPTSRNTKGVRAIRLSDDDRVTDMEIVPGAGSEEEKDHHLLTITENGYGKRTALKQYPTIHRGGKGVINIKSTDTNGPNVGSMKVTKDDEIVIVTRMGMLIRTNVGSVSPSGRATIGKIVIRMKDDDSVVDISTIIRDDDSE